jgi:prepilin-type N-terminal cleavage/methylation domain-containing protein
MRSGTEAKLQRCGGFTAVELVVTIILVAILAATAIARWGSTADKSVGYQADRLARDIRHAQMLAFTRSEKLTLTIASTTSYQVVDGGGAVITDPAKGGNFVQDLQNGVTISGGPSIAFDGLGRPTSGGAPAGASVSFTVSGDAKVATVTVAPLTGFVTVTY